MVNLWSDIPPGDDPPNIVNAVIEVISRSRDKYEYNREWEAFVLDRVIHSSVVFPVEYGFIPQTWYNDNDPLDIMVLSYEPLEVGCIIKVRPIGALLLEDEEGEDPKILSVPLRDPRFEGFHNLADVHPHRLKEIQEFFETYKRLEPKKWARFKAWKNEKEAKEIIEYAIELYNENFKTKK
ncbi:inorganic diphosphatase [Candidatus Bathyarchaeota archaeon]|nr:MAG: inorganic pyrophosphatase [Candidatus Bathyarchaeota archaeon ex4484_40]RJS78433.1 MAG: inorganic diphosphatase [Candidatus Bathyarchaeota archaeon]